MRRNGFTAVELVLVIVVLVILVTVTMVQVDKRRQAALRESSAHNLEFMVGSFAACRMTIPRIRTTFAGPDDPERERIHRLFASVLSSPMPPFPWPRLSDEPGNMALVLSPEFVTYLLKYSPPVSLVSPSHPQAERMVQDAITNPKSSLTDDSYWYIDYEAPNEQVGLAMIEAYTERVKKLRTLQTSDEDSGFLPIMPLKTRIQVEFEIEGEETHITYDSLKQLWWTYGHGTKLTNQRSASTTPVLIERPGLQRGGSNVLFYDRHVEFIPYGR